MNYFLYERYIPGFGAYFTAVEPISLLNHSVTPNITLPENSLDKLFPDLENLEIREIDYSIFGGGGGGGSDFSWFTDLFSGSDWGKIKFIAGFLCTILITLAIPFALICYALSNNLEFDNKIIIAFVIFFIVLTGGAPFLFIST